MANCECNGCRVMNPLPADRFEMGTYEMGYDYTVMSQEEYDAMTREWRRLVSDQIHQPNPLLTALRSRV